MKCTDFKAMIDDALGGELSPAEVAEFRRHREICDDCREEYDSLDMVVKLAGELPAEISPRNDLWDGIAERIGDRNVVQFPRAGRYLRTAAAILIFGIAGLIGGYFLGRQGPDRVARSGVQPTPAGIAEASFAWQTIPKSFERARNDLRDALAKKREQLEPETVAMIEDNLEIIDQAIVEIVAALEENPNDHRLQQQLYFACSQEINLLQKATALPGEA